jgi:transposase InsO family protein
VERRRARLAAPPAIARARPASARALTAPQQRIVLDLLHAPRFADQAPAEIYATLLDQGVYHCSIRTMYRILEQNGEVRERRQQLRHPVYQKPELLAEEPNEVWSWDITKLMGPAKWSYFYLYVILDIFSRRVVGWCVADAETASLFQPLFDDAIEHLLRLVQPGSSSFGYRPDDPGPGGLRSDQRRSRRPPGHPRSGVPCKPRPLRQKSTGSARKANRHMDQPAHAETYHLNADLGSVEVIRSPRASRRPGCVTRIDSLHHLLLSRFMGEAGQGPGGIAVGTRRGRLHCDPLRNAMRSPRHDDPTLSQTEPPRISSWRHHLGAIQPTPRTELKFRTRLYQSR